MSTKVQFAIRLRNMLQNFELEEADKLSLEIHQVEEQGYELIALEEILWARLTERIEQAYEIEPKD